MLKLAVDNSTPATVADQRRALLAKVHVARKQLGMVEDDYRATLARVTGHTSAKDCSNRQLDRVLSELTRMGFSAARRTRSPRAGSGVARKARALWIGLYQLGAIGDRSEAALEAFGRRQLHVDRLQWANESEGFRLIEALKAIAERHGWAQAVSSRLPALDRVRLTKDRLVGAQLARLAAAGAAVTGPLAADRADWSDKRLESAAAELAPLIRSATAPA